MLYHSYKMDPSSSGRLPRQFCDVSDLRIDADATIRDALACMNANDAMLALVLDSGGRLIDTITDGDVRRGMLNGLKLDTPVCELRQRKQAGVNPVPMTASQGSDPARMLQAMLDASVRHLPLLDDQGKVVDLVTRRQLVPAAVTPLEAVVMAGGEGQRLRPLTKTVPKPMLPLGEKPLLERTIERLRDAGIQQVSISTNYMGEQIEQHFGDGSQFGVAVSYLTEKESLGTAGSLGLLDRPDKPFLVINGDIVTGVDFGAMLTYHQDHEAVLTVGVREYDLNVPYGVVETKDAIVTGLVEKPLLQFFVNAGIYLLEPDALQFIPGSGRFDMTQLIQSLIDAGRTVVSFPIHEYWLDIGQPVDYEQAQADYRDGRLDR